MPFTPSVAPDITESLPAPLSARHAAASYSLSTLAYDVAVAGLPFLLALDTSRPYRRQTADVSKQQLDTSKEAGEQTLSQWWTRSQDSWHRGEGINFYEPGSDDATQFRYGHAVGVDVWTLGQVSLLHSMNKVATTGNGEVVYAATGGTGLYYTNENGVLRRRSATTVATYATSGTAPVTIPCVTGSKVLVGHNNGIDVGNATGTSLSKLYTSATGELVTPWWAKSRIVATRGASLFELALVPDSGPAPLPDPLYTHPIDSWVWTAIADSPGAILAAGHSDGHSAIYKFALEDSDASATPKLGQAYQVAEFPPGETVTALRVYLGQYVGIGTSRGLRVGLVGSDGSVQYGPLIVETTSPVLDLAARDSFIYAAVTNAIDGMSGAVRVNLGEPLADDLRYAYAWDVQAHVTGNATSVAFLGDTDRVALAVSGHGVYLQSDTNYEPTGYVRSGRVRFATSELKAFKRVRINARCDAAGSGVAILTVDNRDTETFVFRVTDLDGDGVDVGLNLVNPLPNLALKLQLTSSTDTTGTPVLDAVLLKALPSVRRQRLIQYPLLCMDDERDRDGNRQAIQDGAALRLFALEELESTQATVLVQDFRVGDTYEGQIESIEFTGNTAPDRQNGNFGGFVTLTVRRLV